MNTIQILLVQALNLFFYVLEMLIFARVLLSWLPIGRGSAIVQLLYSLTDPILGPCRRMLDKSPLGGGLQLDFSPIIALILMMLVKQLLISAVLML